MLALAGPVAWIQHSVRASTYSAVADLPARPVAIVPGAAVYRGEPLGSLTDRLQAALFLLKEGHVEAILISGKNTPEQPEVTVMHEWLLRHGVPDGRLLVDDQGTRTWNTMANARSVFGVKEAIVCTQALYLPRTLYIARSIGIDAVGAALSTPVPMTPHAIGLEAAKTTLAFIQANVRGKDSGPVSSRLVASR
jgi:SanA protein